MAEKNWGVGLDRNFVKEGMTGECGMKNKACGAPENWEIYRLASRRE